MARYSKPNVEGEYYHSPNKKPDLKDRVFKISILEALTSFCAAQYRGLLCAL